MKHKKPLGGTPAGRPRAGDRGKPPRKIHGPKVLTGSGSRGTSKKVDVFAGKGSVAGGIKKRRKQLESGDPRAGHPVPGKRSSHN